MPLDAFSTVHIDDSGAFDAMKFLDVLEGRASVYWAKRVMAPSDCERVVQRFRESPNRITYAVRPVIYTIGVPGGGSLFTVKDLRTYLRNAAETQRMTRALFDGMPNYIQRTLEQIQGEFARMGIVYRLARYENFKAFYSILRGWGEAGVGRDGLAARIHEDREQILHPLQDGFEVQQTYANPQASLNCCYGSTERGGELTVYNAIPSREDFALEEVKEFGYGFPQSLVQGVPSVSIRPEAGDMFVLRSDLLHAVGASYGNGYRLTAATLTALKTETIEQQRELMARHLDLGELYTEMHRRFGGATRTALFWS